MNVYPYNDLSDSTLHFYLRRLYKLSVPVYFHRNMCDGEKDFGVCRDRISEVVYKVK